MWNQIWVRLQLLFAHGMGIRIGHEKVQARVLSGEVLENIDRVEPYGFSYRPKPGCRTYLIFPSGDHSYGVAIVIGDERYEMTLQEGEVALHDDAGNHVHIKRGGIIEANASAKVIAKAPLFEATGNAIVRGNLVVEGNTISQNGYFGTNGGVALMQGGLRITGDFTVNGKNVSDSHTHTGNGPGVPTSGVN
uniref:Phage baseplate assembly protein V n=1 Tax=Candidatus Kentrum sp. LFY TaxID=2126342 RepID=A0A450UE43_9GAMM|nr:MAG: phage baseplate assembly protein V [Candidatus Kentron sp. LFY]